MSGIKKNCRDQWFSFINILDANGGSALSIDRAAKMMDSPFAQTSLDHSVQLMFDQPIECIISCCHFNCEFCVILSKRFVLSYNVASLILGTRSQHCTQRKRRRSKVKSITSGYELSPAPSIDQASWIDCMALTNDVCTIDQFQRQRAIFLNKYCDVRFKKINCFLLYVKSIDCVV